MKSPVFATLFFFCLAITCNAQWTYKEMSKNKHFFYSSGDYIVSKNSAGNVGLNYVYKNKFSFSVGYSATNKSKFPLPTDFLKSGNEVSALDNIQPFQTSDNIHLLAGRIFSLSEKRSVRLLLQAGPGVSSNKWPEFYTQNNTINYKMETSHKLSIIVNPKLEVPLCATFGISAGPMLIANKDKQYLGAGIGLMYGIIGKNNNKQ